MIHHKDTVHLVNRKGDNVVATLIFFDIPSKAWVMFYVHIAQE